MKKLLFLLFVLFSCQNEEITPNKQYYDVSVISSDYGEESFDTQDVYHKGELLDYNGHLVIIYEIKPLN